MSRPKTVIPLVTIGQAQEFGAIIVPAARLLPQFSGLNRWKQNFLGVACIHFFANDGFNFPQHPKTEWQPVVNTRSDSADHAGPQHQLMTDNLGVGWCFLERGKEKARTAHKESRRWVDYSRSLLARESEAHRREAKALCLWH